MAFQLVYFSQQDPAWKGDILGFGEPEDTIGYVGCALTSVAMLLSGHGHAETPKSLNQKLKNVQGFVSAAIRWNSVSQLYPNVTVKSNISCASTAAPLELIDASIDAGQPAIVQVDSSPADGIQTHWVVVYEKKGEDYRMLDPWPYQPDVHREDLLMRRYSRGNPLRRAISHVILYEVFSPGPAAPVVTPPGGTSTSTPMPVPAGGVLARVKESVTWGLNIRSSIDTSTMANVLAVVPPGTQLTLLDSDGASRIGAVNQWVRVRTPQGQEGFAAAWYLEAIPGAPAAPVAEPVPAPVEEPPAAPSTPIPPGGETAGDRLTVVVASAVGTSGLRLRKIPSKGGGLIAVLRAGTRLTVLDPARKAKERIGKANQWLHVRTPDNKRGYVSAEFVSSP